MDKQNFIMSYSIDKTFDSERFLKLRLRVCHDGESPNKTYFTKETMAEANKTLEYIPLLCHVYIDKETGKPVIGSHDMHIEEDKLNEGETRVIYDEIPIGVVPSLTDNNCTIEEFEGMNYTFVDCYLWRDYANYAEQLVEDATNTKLSMEIDFPSEALSYDAKNKRYNISSYRYRGITLLNEELGTGMKNAMATTENFSANDDVKSKMIVLMEELQKCLREYDKNLNKGGGEAVNKFEELLEKYGKTVEDIDFEYEGLSDEQLEAKFEEVFGDAVTPAGEPTVDPVTEGDPASDNGEGDPVADPEPATGEKFTKTFTIELSHEDINAALYNLIVQYEEVDNCYYYIREVFDDYFYMQSWYANKLYKQNYKIDGENVSLEGDRQEVFEIIVTESEKIALEKLRGDYAELEAKCNEFESELQSLREFKANYDAAQLKAQKEAILNKEEYACLAENEAFKMLVDEADKYSVEELSIKADLVLAAYAKATFSANKVEEDKQTAMKFSIKSNDKAKKKVYGDLFD